MPEEKKTKQKRKAATGEKRAKRDKKQILHLLLWALGLCVWVGVMYYVAQLIVFSCAGWVIRWIRDANGGFTFNETTLQSICVLISDALALALIILLPKLVFKNKYKTSLDELGIHGWPTWTDVLLGPVGYLASMIASVGLIMLLAAFVPAINWEQAQDVGYNNLFSASDKMVAFLVLVVLTPIVEELVFRGWLYGKLRGRLKAVPAIILVSLLFAVMHGQWNVGVIVFAMSIFLCIGRELTGTIYTGIIMHMIRNGVAFYLLYASPFSGGTSAALPLLMAFLV